VLVDAGLVVVPPAGFEPATHGLGISFAGCITAATRYFVLHSSRHAVIAAPRGASSHHDSHHARTQGANLTASALTRSAVRFLLLSG
jgi:hypothetical protein